MKKFLSFVALLCFAVTSFAQMVNPIKWSSEMKEDGKNVEITFKAAIDKGWHLYGTELPSADGLRLPTYLSAVSRAPNSTANCS